MAGKKVIVRSPACERNAKDGVHGPDRLKVLNPCATFQGTVSQAPEKDADGDVSFDVSPDPGYASMLNARNRSEGGLHIEIVPRDQPGCTPGQPVVFGIVPNLGICSGRDLVAPRPGAHVRIIGPWVVDLLHHWYEIHPAWAIATPAPRVGGCRVPRLVGRTLKRARAAIVRNGCSVGKVSHRSSRKRLRGHVIAQHPHPGSLLREHASVTLTLGRK